MVGVSTHLDGGGEKLLTHGWSKSLVEPSGPPSFGKLRHPDDIHEKDIDRGITILQLLRQEIVIGRRAVRGQFAHDRNIRMRFREFVEGLVPHARVIGLPGDETQRDGGRLSLGWRCRSAGDRIVERWTEENQPEQE
jgi:hypothetical protein